MDRITQKKSLTNSILALRRTYAAQGLSLWDIGNGDCENFAYDVLSLAFGENWIHTADKTYCDVQTENFYTPSGFEWDWDLLKKHWNIEVQVEKRQALDDIILSGPNHVWITLDKKHYDCEHPQGVDSFFDLNFFKRYLGENIPTENITP